MKKHAREIKLPAHHSAVLKAMSVKQSGKPVTVRVVSGAQMRKFLRRIR